MDAAISHVVRECSRASDEGRQSFAVIVGKLILSTMKKRARRNMHTRIASIIGEVFGADLGEFTDRHPARSIGAALAAGFVLGFSPKLRKALMAFVRR